MDYRDAAPGLVVDAGSAPVSRSGANKVLRNTYALLTLTLLPTLAGVWFGLYSGIQMRGFLGIALFLVGAIAFQVVIAKYRNSAAGVYLLLGFCTLMGWMLSNVIAWVLRFSNGAELLMLALGGTALTMAGMTALASTIKRDLKGFGQFMYIGMWVLLAVGLIAYFAQIPTLHIVVLVGVVAVFSGLLVFDVQRVINGGETNYVMATMAIYLNLLNIFSALLQLLGISSGQSE